MDREVRALDHWGRATQKLLTGMAHYQAQGQSRVFLAGVRCWGSGLMDTTAQLPGYVELIELGAGFEPIFSKFYRASIGWDERSGALVHSTVSFMPPRLGRPAAPADGRSLAQKQRQHCAHDGTHRHDHHGKRWHLVNARAGKGE